VDEFLAAMRDSELAGHIDNELSADIAAPAGLRGFEIRT
jgi:hypothetical protein